MILSTEQRQKWPDRCLHSEDGKPMPFHLAQNMAWDSTRRTVAMIAGSQGGKTGFLPWWLKREIYDIRGGGDYLAVTASFDLFKLKMLPAMLLVFEQIFGIGRYWTGDKIIELRNPVTGEFMAKRSVDPMWGRIILRSADALYGLESSTSRAACLDECVSPETLIATEFGNLSIDYIVKHRLNIRVWSYNVANENWELKPIARWIRLGQKKLLYKFGKLSITKDHKILTRCGYVECGIIARNNSITNKEGAIYNDKIMRVVWKRTSGGKQKSVLQPYLCNKESDESNWREREVVRETKREFQESQNEEGYFGSTEKAIFQSGKPPVVSTRRGTIQPFGTVQQETIRNYKTRENVVTGWEWPTTQLETGENGSNIRMEERICSSDGEWMATPLLQNRRSRTGHEDSNRDWESCQSKENTVVRGEWVDVSSILEQNGRSLDGGLSSDGYVYNIEVEGNHNYVADGILVANCGQDRFSFQAYKAIRRRIALHRGRMLMTTTLYNLGWVSSNIIDPCMGDGKIDYHTVGTAEIERTDSKKMDTTVIQFDSTINPVFPQSEFDEAKALLPDDEFQMYYRGRKATRRFLIYDSFDIVKHTRDPFEIPSHWRKYMGLDFGGANTCAVYYAEDPETRILYAYREYLSGGKSIKQHATDLLFKEVGIPFCVGGAASEGQWRAEFGWHGLSVYKPAIGDLDLGINRVYAQHQMNGIIYFKTLYGIIDQKGRYRRKRSDIGEALDDILDKETYHYLDAERYIISTIRPGTTLRAKVVRLGL